MSKSKFTSELRSLDIDMESLKDLIFAPLIEKLKSSSCLLDKFIFILYVSFKKIKSFKLLFEFPPDILDKREDTEKEPSDGKTAFLITGYFFPIE